MTPTYVDSCLVLSLFLGDGGYGAAETWLLLQGDQPLWVSHWVLLELELFRQQRLSLIEPRGGDFFQARHWLQEFRAVALRSGDALHLALAKRHNLLIATADRNLVRAADALSLPCQWID
ncbi:type II toxin-antitoxin system VapC family toxin [Synechococcus sp. CS-602]|uniref:type II toxin-antitoxin system VapC family toxin n=1 Tax=Synechococcaceae TaxID=1890426 RepID=UPI0008FF6F7F|nr:MULTISPECIES: type II toxin-antitoxin system VapC family toxin [Synechococcaceae]APD48754.1 hypothetical protein BM449_11525 [Synechococcus sp. SynAce01]MCT0201780.1 type II toxin-antitoxin system VapC family toxin [Synechococcus sp. CS-603]MCT0203855.1 type II toxin-antitoxin system VapC family toxin [Synechococcus sp. CS-602]MCT0244710.1 type II toxin-antitoxin system VapC family toxin [Synechococcus sp. CS-601]MCT4367032.1 type II toxin-antitoxin system VapC family toxin [Candidatus Regn